MLMPNFPFTQTERIDLLIHYRAEFWKRKINSRFIRGVFASDLHRISDLRVLKQRIGDYQSQI
jgi:hypothetical protein